MRLEGYLIQSLSGGVGGGEFRRVLTNLTVLMSEIQVTGYPVFSLSLGKHTKAEPFSDPCQVFMTFLLHFQQTWLLLPPSLGKGIDFIPAARVETLEKEG